MTGSVNDTLFLEPGNSELSASEAYISLEQTMLDIACKAPVSVQLMTFFGALIIAFMASDHAGFALAILWFSLTMTVSAIRFWALRFWIPSLSHLDATQKLNLTSVFIFAIAATFGSSSIFFVGYPVEERMIQIFIICLGGTATLFSVGGTHRPFLCTVIPLFSWLILALVYDFLKNENQLSVLIAALCFFYCLTLIQFSLLYHKYFFVASYKREKELSTTLQRLNRALKVAEAASESKSLFFASASHDLRQPIHTASLLMTTLSMCRLDEKPKRIVKDVESAIDNLSNQMDAMLDIAKLDAGIIDTNFINVDCCELLRGLVREHQQIAQKKQIELNANISDNKVLLKTDKVHIERIIRNLLGNAIKYTEQGSVTVSLQKNSDFVCIEINDTGIGISDIDQEKIFDEFFQVGNPDRDRRKGLGLGLSIVKRLSALLGASLDFESVLGKGTRFRLSIPLLNDNASELEDSSNSYYLDVSGKSELNEFDRNITILCVDDEAEVLSATTSLLGDLGYKVISSSTTEEAYSTSKDTKPDALLVDFRLGAGDDGLLTVSRIRELYPKMPAIIISGDTSKERLQQVNDAGVPLLNKPVRIEQIERVLHQLLKS